MKNSVMIVAAEASSALFAERLLQYWKKSGRDIEAFGVGTAAMEAMGFQRFGKAEEMAVVGLTEVIRHYSFLKGIFQQLVDEAKKRKPDVVVLLDYPEFNLRLAKELHGLGLNVVFYVSPQIWAWRQGRVEQIKKYCREVLLLFPFEVDFYKKHNVAYQFVGHPLLDEIHPEYLDSSWQRTRRAQCGFGEKDIVIGLMPGSRKMEIQKLFKLQLDVARKLCQQNHRVKILILVAPTLEKEDLHPFLEETRFPYVMLKDDPARMIAITDYILAASGTATLMVGLLEKPMVIVYKLSTLTAFIARRIVKGPYGLPNLILGHLAVPELFQENATVKKVTEQMTEIIENPKVSAKMKADLQQLSSRLGDRGATERVAKALERYLDATT